MITVKDAEEVIKLHGAIKHLRAELAVLDTWKFKKFSGNITLANGTGWDAQEKQFPISGDDLGQDLVSRLIRIKASKVDEMCRRLRQLNAEVPE